MVADKVLTFKPTDEENDYLTVKNITWSKYCHDNLRRDISNNRYTYLNAVATYLLIIAVGVIFSFISMVVLSTDIVIISMYVLSGVLVVFGTFSIIGVLRYGRF